MMLTQATIIEMLEKILIIQAYAKIFVWKKPQLILLEYQRLLINTL
jgi:hypothetical protein